MNCLEDEDSYYYEDEEDYEDYEDYEDEGEEVESENLSLENVPRINRGYFPSNVILENIPITSQERIEDGRIEGRNVEDTTTTTIPTTATTATKGDKCAVRNVTVRDVLRTWNETVCPSEDYRCSQ